MFELTRRSLVRQLRAPSVNQEDAEASVCDNERIGGSRRENRHSLSIARDGRAKGINYVYRDLTVILSCARRA